MTFLGMINLWATCSQATNQMSKMVLSWLTFCRSFWHPRHSFYDRCRCGLVQRFDTFWNYTLLDHSPTFLRPLCIYHLSCCFYDPTDQTYLALVSQGHFVKHTLFFGLLHKIGSDGWPLLTTTYSLDILTIDIVSRLTHIFGISYVYDLCAHTCDLSPTSLTPVSLFRFFKVCPRVSHTVCNYLFMHN